LNLTASEVRLKIAPDAEPMSRGDTLSKSGSGDTVIELPKLFEEVDRKLDLFEA
jgi:hypothetical protein